MPVRMRPDLNGQGREQVRHSLCRAREVYARIAALPGVRALGVDMHIGSQITNMAPFDNAFALLAELVRDLKSGLATTFAMSMSAADSASSTISTTSPPRTPTPDAAIVREAHRPAGRVGNSSRVCDRSATPGSWSLASNM